MMKRRIVGLFLLLMIDGAGGRVGGGGGGGRLTRVRWDRIQTHRIDQS